MGKFVIHTVKTGYTFDLRARNGETITTSEVYKTVALCRSGIETIRRNAEAAAIEDKTAKKKEASEDPKFEVYRDNSDRFRFRFTAADGEVVAASGTYNSKASCLNGIESVKSNAVDADILIG